MVHVLTHFAFIFKKLLQQYPSNTCTLRTVVYHYFCLYRSNQRYSGILCFGASYASGIAGFSTRFGIEPEPNSTTSDTGATQGTAKQLAGWRSLAISSAIGSTSSNQ
jgi:hypothetical protein